MTSFNQSGFMISKYISYSTFKIGLTFILDGSKLDCLGISKS